MFTLRTSLLLLCVALGAACGTDTPNEAPDGPDSGAGPDAVPATPGVPAELGESRAITVDGAGYNPRFVGVEEPWELGDRDFAGALAESKARIIRYPGGTFTNSWDYEHSRLFPKKSSQAPTGWVDTSKITTEPGYDLIEADDRKPYTVADLAKVAAGPDAVRVVFHMNMVTPGADFYAATKGWTNPHPGTNCKVSPGDDWCKMLDDRYRRFRDMLIDARDNHAIAIDLVELGNEYYFPHDYIVEAFPRADSLGRAANYIADRVHADFGNKVHVATVASRVLGAGARSATWNTDLASTLDTSKVDAVTIHAYKQFEVVDTYTEATFQQALVDWIDASGTTFTDSGADATFVGKTPIWYTETNANWDGQAVGATPVPKQAWAQVLADAFSAVYLYERGGASMMLQFQFDNQVRTAPVDGHLLYNRALALQPFMLAAAGASRVTALRFGGTDLPKLPGDGRAVVQGVCFGGASEIRRCFVINLGGEDVNLDLRVAFPGAVSATVAGYRQAIDSSDVAIAFSSAPPLASVIVPGFAVAVVTPAP